MSRIEVESKLGRRIKITDSYWQYITRVKHREMVDLKDTVAKTISNPIEIRKSLKDPSVYLYYGRHGKMLICVVTSI